MIGSDKVALGIYQNQFVSFDGMDLNLQVTSDAAHFKFEDLDKGRFVRVDDPAQLFYDSDGRGEGWELVL